MILYKTITVIINCYLPSFHYKGLISVILPSVTVHCQNLPPECHPKLIQISKYTFLYRCYSDVTIPFHKCLDLYLKPGLCSSKFLSIPALNENTGFQAHLKWYTLYHKPHSCSLTKNGSLDSSFSSFFSIFPLDSSTHNLLVAMKYCAFSYITSLKTFVFLSYYCQVAIFIISISTKELHALHPSNAILLVCSS